MQDRSGPGRNPGGGCDGERGAQEVREDRKDVVSVFKICLACPLQHPVSPDGGVSHSKSPSNASLHFMLFFLQYAAFLSSFPPPLPYGIL